MDTRYVIIVAGGKGLRMGSDRPKQFLEVAGKPIIVYTIEKFYLTIPDIRVIVVLPEDHRSYWKNIKAQYFPNNEITITNGGKTRFDSVKNGLKLVGERGLVAIHDAVRPCVSAEVINNAFTIAKDKKNAIVAVALKDSIRKLTGNKNEAVDRKNYQIIQTPQIFEISLIKNAFKVAKSNNFTDDASVAEAYGTEIHLVEGNYENIKVTTPEDLSICEVFLREM